MSTSNTAEDILTRYAVDSETGCWIWQRYKDSRGYGVTCYEAKTRKAHRFFYEHLVGPIPRGRVVCHSCDNPSCVNPDHLFVGTQRDNILDCIHKGRARRTPRAGEKHHNAKLTEDDVRRIRAEPGPQSQIARRYGVNQSVICDIRRRKAWTHVA